MSKSASHPRNLAGLALAGLRLAGIALLGTPLLAQTPQSQQTKPTKEPETKADKQQTKQPPSEKRREPGQKPTVVITATRLAQKPFQLPYSTETVSSEDFQNRSYRSTPQALRDIPGVMVQETAHGHGSPYIRGFTSFRNLFLIDGIRLNNSVFRSGPNQYWNTVDPFSLDRLEVVKGPSSVLYGSDAVGGTVNAFTKSSSIFQPNAQENDGLAYGGQTFLRYSSAENSVQGRGELSFGKTWEDGSRTGLLLGGSAKSFGDLEGGDGVGTQFDTGYEDVALDIKLEHFFDEDTKLVFLHHRVSQNDVPRTHRTVNAVTWRGLSSGSDLQRNFDQDRTLTYVQYHKENIGGAIDAFRASVSLQQQKEVRDRIRGNGNQEVQGFDVDTYGFWAQFESDTQAGLFTYGIEYYRDEVDSFLRRVANPNPADAIQGPIADEAAYDLLGIFVQDQFEPAKNLQVILGGRFNFAALDADSVRDPATSNQTSLDDNWSSFVGSARILYGVVPGQVNVFGGVSQGFRAPNLSDMTRFDTARSNEFEIPASNLDPEYYISYEAGVKVETEDVSAQASYFYTDIQDQILRFPTGNVNGSGESEVTKANVGDGHVYGVELGIAGRVHRDVTLFGNATYIEGRVTNFPTAGAGETETYLTRLMPFTMQAGVRWEEEQKRFWAETVLVHASKADRLSLGDRRDTSRVVPGGTPDYTVWHLRGGWNVSQNTSFNVLFENITDVDYRVHGSGQNRPGQNFIVSFTTRF